MIIQHRFVDLLRDDVSREFTEALAGRNGSSDDQEEIQMMISGMVDQIEARLVC